MLLPHWMYWAECPFPCVKTECNNRKHGGGRKRCAHAVFSSFSLAWRLKSRDSADIQTHTRTHRHMPVCTCFPFSTWLKHMIALAWCPLTPSCLSLPDRSAERIKAQRKARGEPEFTSTPAQQLCFWRRLRNPLHYTTQRFCGCVIGRSKAAYAQRNIHTTACVGCLVWYHARVPVSPHYLCSYWPHDYQDFDDVKNVETVFF